MKKIILLATVFFTLSSCSSVELLQMAEDVLGQASGQRPVTELEVINGLKQALELGITKGADIVSKPGGYLRNPSIKIPLPQEVRKVESTLRKFGLDKEMDRVIATLNQGAEDAAQKAKPIFVSAIKQMTIKDAMGILKASNNSAATEYLKRTTTKQLTTAFKPEIQKSLNKVNATKYWRDLTSTYNKLSLGKTINTDLNAYVTDMALKGLFTMIAKEEAKIRKDPIARTTELLKRVFRLQDR